MVDSHVSIRPTDIRRVANVFVAPAIFMVFAIDVNAYNIYNENLIS